MKTKYWEILLFSLLTCLTLEVVFLLAGATIAIFRLLWS